MAGEQEMICFHPPVESGGQSRGQEVGTSSDTAISGIAVARLHSQQAAWGVGLQPDTDVNVSRSL